MYLWQAQLADSWRMTADRRLSSVNCYLSSIFKGDELYICTGHQPQQVVEHYGVAGL